MKSKKAAIELSISTIVIVVLGMSMLILGLVLVKTIFTGAKNVAEMSNDQVESEISKLFGENNKVVVYPSSRQVDVVQGEASGFGIGIKNLMQSSSANAEFSYMVTVSDVNVIDKCAGWTAEEVEGLITTGQSETGLSLGTGELYSTTVLFNTDIGAPLCTVRFKVETKVNNEPYGSPQVMDVTFTA